MRVLEQFKSLLSGRASRETRALAHLAQASALSAQGDLDGAMAQLHAMHFMGFCFVIQAPLQRWFQASGTMLSMLSMMRRIDCR